MLLILQLEFKQNILFWFSFAELTIFSNINHYSEFNGWHYFYMCFKLHDVKLYPLPLDIAQFCYLDNVWILPWKPGPWNLNRSQAFDLSFFLSLFFNISPFNGFFLWGVHIFIHTLQKVTINVWVISQWEKVIVWHSLLIAKYHFLIFIDSIVCLWPRLISDSLPISRIWILTVILTHNREFSNWLREIPWLMSAFITLTHERVIQIAETPCFFSDGGV